MRVSPKNSIGRVIRYFVVVALASTMFAASAQANCSVCNIQLQHRTGPFTLIVSGDSRYEAGSRYYVDIAVVNGTHAAPLRVDPARVASTFLLTAFAPSYSSQEHSQAPVRGTKTILPGERFRFPRKALQDWGLLSNKPGTYRISLAYDGVDSNVYTFQVYR